MSMHPLVRIVDASYIYTEIITTLHTVKHIYIYTSLARMVYASCRVHTMPIARTVDASCRVHIAPIYSSHC